MLCSLCDGLFVMYTSSVLVGCPVVAFSIFSNIWFLFAYHKKKKKKKMNKGICPLALGGSDPSYSRLLMIG